MKDGDEGYACEHCNPIKTVATTQRILINTEKYIIMKLKTFSYDRGSNHSFEIIPNLII